MTHAKEKAEAARTKADCALRDHPTLGRWLRQSPTSQNRNLKLRELAAEIVADISGKPPEPSAFQHRHSPPDSTRRP